MIDERDFLILTLISLVHQLELLITKLSYLKEHARLIPSLSYWLASNPWVLDLVFYLFALIQVDYILCNCGARIEFFSPVFVFHFKEIVEVPVEKEFSITRVKASRCCMLQAGSIFAKLYAH